MRVLFVAAIFLASTLAQAQVIKLDFQGQNEIAVSAADCGSERSVTWTVAATGQTPCRELVVWATSDSCSKDEPGSNPPDKRLGAVDTTTLISQRTGSISFVVRDLPGVGATVDGGTESCEDAKIEKDFEICAAFKTQSFSYASQDCSVVQRASQAAVVRFDSVPPSAPGLGAVTEGDGALTVRVDSATDDTRFFHAEAAPSGTEDWASRGPFSGEQRTFKVDGLDNGVEYAVRVAAEDGAGNVGDFSEPVYGTPVKTYGFFETYVDAGGKERGGCTEAGGGSAAVPALVALGWLWARRFKKWAR